MINEEWIIAVIRDFVASSPENSLGLPTGEKAFAEPLVGFSSGADPLYEEFRRHIGGFYFTPQDLFQQTFSHEKAAAAELTVISWILPSTTRTRAEQSSQEKFPSERWIRTRALGEDFNTGLRRHVQEKLQENGIAAIAPLLSPLWSRSDQGPYAPCSNWSERHAAFAAGLGTFGLCDGLITPVGKAVRVGSVIAEITLSPSRRPYDNHHAYCLHYTHDTCRQCIPRCPVNAISLQGHDKKRCMEYTERIMNRYIRETFGIETYACGLCQAGTACMDRIPVPEDVE